VGAGSRDTLSTVQLARQKPESARVEGDNAVVDLRLPLNGRYSDEAVGQGLSSRRPDLEEG
jgi:hypothetical protein